MSANLQSALAGLQAQGVLPRALTPGTVRAISRRLDDFAELADQNKKAEALDRITDVLEALNNPKQVLREGATRTVTEGFSQATARSEINLLLESLGVEKIADTLNVDFMARTASSIAGGAGTFIQDNQPGVVAAYPALELERFYDRRIPRGLREGKDGALVEMPQDAWDTENGRWQEALNACADAEDQKARMQEIFQTTGRMIALKNSDIWPKLGTLRGDSLGNRFAPFAFNSGYRTRNVARAECVALGLIDAGAAVSPAAINPAEIIALPEVAA